MFIRTESFSSFMAKFPLTTFIIGLQVLLWAFFSLPFKDAPYWFSQADGFNAAISDGQWWRLITPIFLHASFTHLFFNTLSLILFAPALEEMLKKGRFALIYFGSGIAGNAATYFIQPPDYSHVGASGAIFGLFGCYLFMAFFRKSRMSQANAQVLVIILALSLLTSFFSPSTNTVAHFFGLAAGFGLAAILLKKEAFAHYTFYSESKRAKPVKWDRKTILIAVIVLLAVIGIIASIT
ncbi:rhomboid family intramembrane serine protease [Metabacillus sp. FJAT-52054]|uniref:Rhomboid family intramembrane serine protease n=1 Tax=Metabacillus sediminis TaxID=3117746 RepID=A0ABZ2NHF8_9BACI